MKYSMLGDANNAGPVRLSDVYDSDVGGASAGVAASQKALYEAYNSLNSRLLGISIFKQRWTLDPTSSQSIPAGGAKPWTKNIAVSGATPVGAVGMIGSGTSGSALIDFWIDNNILTCYISNPKTSAATISNIRVDVLYIKGI